MNNPYQTPQADLTQSDNQDPQELLAKRSTRFISAFIDGIIGMLIAIPFWMLSGAWSIVRSGSELPPAYALAAAVYGFVGFILVHTYFLNKNGQTVGKKLMNIRIEGVNGQLQTAPALLTKRYLPLTAASLIPFVGSLLVLIDILFIFRKDRRCIHDLIAGTRVVSC